ncbi:MAG: methyltransferase domain-containing protein [Methanobacteriota archaeon]|nr:MAG: methyltransferase domain-containing protein [Euryarchaeota archaeon]
MATEGGLVLTKETQPPIEIVHFADPWCWWSWGLEPVLQRLREVYGDNLRVTYKMGGQFETLEGWMREYGVDERSTVDWIVESVAMTNMPLQPDYYRRTGVQSSFPACRAFKAAQIQSEDLAARYFRRMMEAFALECRPGKDETLLLLAAEVGLDAERLRRDMDSKRVQEAFEADREEMAKSGVNYMSLLIRNRGGESVIKGETFAAKPFEEIIDRLAPGLPKRSPADILEYMEHHKGMTTANEIAAVFRIPVDDAEARLDRLKEFLECRSLFDSIETWRWKGTSLDRLPLAAVKDSHVPPEVQIEAVADLKPIVTKAVQSLYTEVATRPDKEYHFPLGLRAVKFVGYPEGDIARLPSTAVESFAGVGYPFATDAIRPGDAVLDIGSGSGTDVLFASLRTGPKGKVYGLDITPAMIAKARENIRKMGVRNVEILEGDATRIPLPDAGVDVVTSNGVLNLVPDKPAAFREIFRVLKPGGRLQLADIVVQEDVGAVCGLNPQLWADCIGGAAVEDAYLAAIRAAGFQDVRVLNRLDYFGKSSSESTRRITKTFGAESVVVAAVKA